MSKTTEKLKLNIWQELLYLLFVMLVPVVISAIEVFSSHSTMFKITFSSIGTVLIAIIVIRKFVLKSQIEKLQNKCLMDEHDYEIDVGNKQKLKHNWAVCNMIILAYHAIVLILSLILAWLFITALSDQVIAFKGASTIILASCLIGIVLKFCFYAFIARYKEESDGEN